MQRLLALSSFVLLVACINDPPTLDNKDSGSDANGEAADGMTPPGPANKLDLLLMVDNSNSMGDKQELLASALPDLVAGVIAKVGDVHVGILSSALGGGGATDICDPNAKISAQEDPTLTQLNRHNDDRGHLINRKKPSGGVEEPVASALPNNVLAWMASGNPTTFSSDFGALASGVGFYGCGLEAQMESWYRFLVQPDPWDAIQLDTGKTPALAKLVGVDQTILQQRHDFLRPDSVVAIVVVTDEEDSWSDPMWANGYGWVTRAQNNSFSTTGQLPRGTQACATNPSSPACSACMFAKNANDPNCVTNKGLYGPKEDGLNVRYTDDMKRRYGANPQFPISRYVDGLASPMVPDRTSEHDEMSPDHDYVGRKICRNPLFAKELPTDSGGELCKLQPGTRTPDQIVFGLIGGVPWQLVPQNGAMIGDADWTKIVGKDPGAYDQTGIDPHMIESIPPRAGIACGPGSMNGCDPIHGREYDTTSSKVGIDLQYACTFALPVPRDCTKVPGSSQCDCGASYTGPLCAPNPQDGNNLTLQVRGKAYPTIRELRVARALASTSVVGSICPKSLDTNSQDYGYRPFVKALIDKLSPLLKK